MDDAPIFAGWTPGFQLSLNATLIWQNQKTLSYPSIDVFS